MKFFRHNCCERFVLLALFVAIGIVSAGRAAAVSKPNVLFILTDDQGRNTLGCYGGTKVPTPHLDALARDGLRFDDAYVTPQCTPTRASLFTGQYTARHGMWHVIPWYGYPWAGTAEPAFVEHLPRDAFTLPKGMRAAGYATGMGGKWHLTSGDGGSYVRLNPEAADAFGFDFVAPPGPGTPNDGDKWVDHLTDEAIGFIREHRARPWFYYLAHHTIHGKVSAPPELIAKYRAAGAPEDGMYNAVYLAAIEHLDSSVGRLLAALDELGLRDRTLVVFLSDNGGIQQAYDPHSLAAGANDGGAKDDAAKNDAGPRLRVEREEFSNGPFRAGKGSPYEGGLRVPCLARMPGTLPAGSVVRTPIHVVDWLPTLLELAGAAPPAGHAVDGRSLLPLLRGGEIPPRPLYWYMPLYDLRWAATPSAVVRDGDWKLIDYFGESFDADGRLRPEPRVELFHLGRDPGERTDLATEQPERAAALQKQLRAWLQSVPAVVPAANPHHDPARAFTESRKKLPWNEPPTR